MQKEIVNGEMFLELTPNSLQLKIKKNALQTLQRSEIQILEVKESDRAKMLCVFSFTTSKQLSGFRAKYD